MISLRRGIALVATIISILLFGITVKQYYVAGTPLRMKETDHGLFIIDSLNGSIYFIHGEQQKVIDDFSFPVWVDTLGNYLYVTDVKGECVYKVSLASFSIVEKVSIKRPEMIKVYNGKIYVSSRNEIYELSKDLKVLRKWRFCASSVYFYFYGDYLLYMNYWKAKKCPDVTVINLKNGNVVKDLYLGFERPLRFLPIYDKWIFLDYKTGKIVFMRNFHVVKRINISPYSYDIVYYKSKIVVSNLFEESLYIIDPVSYKVSKMPLNCEVGDMEVFNDCLFLSCIFDNNVFGMNNWNLIWKIPCKYPIMVTKSNEGVYMLCGDEGKVKFIDVGGKIANEGG